MKGESLMRTLTSLTLVLVIAFGFAYEEAVAAIILQGRNVDSNTAVFLDDGFENDTVGSPPSLADVGSWSTTNPQNLPGVTSAAVPGPYFGNNYLHIARPAAPAPEVTALFNGPVSGGDTLEFSFAMLHTGLYPGIILLNGGAEVARIQGDDTGGTYRMTTEAAGGGGGFQNTGLASTLNVWQEVTMTWDTDGSLFRLTVDGNSFDYTLSKAASNVDRVRFRTDDGGAVFYIDGQIIPEPSAVVLLGMGSIVGGLMLGRRRRID